MDIKFGGIDLAKNVFQVCVCLVDNLIKSNQKFRRISYSRLCLLNQGTKSPFYDLIS